MSFDQFSMENETSSAGSFRFDDHQFQNIVSDDLLAFISLYLGGVVCAAISLLGVVTNIINIIVFIRQGLQDSTTVSLFSLSVTDLGANVSNLMYGASSICEGLGFLDETVDWSALNYVFFSWTRLLFLDMSMLTTVFISLERCLSVTLPLAVRGLVTVSRSKWTAAIIYIFTVTCYVPVFATQGLSWQFNSATNSSKLTLWLGPGRQHVEVFCNSFNNIVLPTCSHLTVIICTYWMIKKLKQSSKFRTKAVLITNNPAKFTSQKDTAGKKNANTSSARAEKTLTGKDQRVAKLVVMVATVFIAFSLPHILVVYGRRFVPDLDVNKRLHNFHWTLFSAVYVIGAINASVNMFIYLYASSKYKAVFRATFCRNSVTL